MKLKNKDIKNGLILALISISLCLIGVLWGDVISNLLGYEMMLNVYACGILSCSLGIILLGKGVVGIIREARK